MKRIFLIGDSIRLGYGPHVREKLMGRAEVLASEDNARFVHYTLRYLHEWADKVERRESVDIVHWNNGLWDALRLFDDEPLTPAEVYEATLPRIYARVIRLFPNAQVHFALTTPVIEAKCGADFRRTNADIDRLNEIASRAMDRLGVPVNDLNKVAKAFPEAYGRDAVHYTDEGSACLADAVVAYLTPALGEA